MDLYSYKNYVFLTEGISNYGGAQLLVLRRAKYLQSLGFSVKIIVQRHRGEFYLKNKFKEIPVLFLPELEFPLSLISNSKKQKLIKTFELFLNDTSNTLLETHSLSTAVWGEYFSQKFNIKHIVYLLNEDQIKHFKYYPGKIFFNFKFKRGELFGCSNKSLEIIFDSCQEGFNEKYINVSFDPDELLELTEPPLMINSVDNWLTISTIGRLEKGYIRSLILACINIAHNNPDRKVMLIIGGGTIYKSIENEIKSEFLPPKTNIANLKIIFTGYITSLGKDFFQITDIFVGMGTASINAISQGCATLNVDPKTNKTSGIFGIDTNNFAYPENNTVYEIEDKILFLATNPEMLLKAKQEGRKLFENNYTTQACFEKLNYLLEKSTQVSSYYKFRINFLNKFMDFILFHLRIFFAKLNI